MTHHMARMREKETGGFIRESKHFFFEKKQQKTFVSWGLGRCRPRGPWRQEQTFFAAFFQGSRPVIW
jgi:hypothetical protein